MKEAEALHMQMKERLSEVYTHAHVMMMFE